jgi:hypothetical protein
MNATLSAISHATVAVNRTFPSTGSHCQLLGVNVIRLKKRIHVICNGTVEVRASPLITAVAVMAVLPATLLLARNTKLPAASESTTIGQPTQPC